MQQPDACCNLDYAGALPVAVLRVWFESAMGEETSATSTTSGRGVASRERWQSVDLVALGGISLLAAALRLLFIEQWSYGPQEAVTWRALTAPLSGHEASFASSREAASPLVYLLLRELLERGVLPGTTEGWLRLPFAFAGCLVTPLVALWARPLLGRAAGVLAALAVAVHPACITSSQTADPAVFAAAATLFAGVFSTRGWRLLAAGAVVIAGLCHPLGWFAAGGVALIGRAPKWWDHVGAGWLLSLVPLAAPAILGLGYGPAWTAALLACLALRGGIPQARFLAGALLLPLAAAGLWCWSDPSVVAAARAITAPFVVACAAWACVQFARAAAGRLEVSAPVGRMVGAAPLLMLIGELLAASFLYFTVYEGDRSAWRDARSAVAAMRKPGEDLVVVAGRGVDVLRTYLRPNHWRLPGEDLHAGVEVRALASGAEARRAQLQEENALFVLLPDERDSMGPAAVELVVLALWPSPKAVGDGSLYVMRRRAPP